MNYLKLAFATICLFILAWLGFKLTSGSDGDLEDVIDSYRVEDPQIVEENLKKFKNQIPQSQFLLYEAYLARKENNLTTSNQKLAEASKKIDSQTHNAIMLEIALNEALNAYLMKDKPTLEAAVKKAANIDEHNGWVLFFQGLLAYEKGECSVALNIWTKEEERLGLSYWMRLDFSKIFSPLWIKLHIAKCEIQEEMILPARELLEGQRNLLKGTQLDEVLFLIGYSYIIEGKNKTPQEAIPLYKQAFSYFNHIPMQNSQYANDRILIQSEITKKALEMIDNKQLQGIQEYILILSQWKADAALEKISQEIAFLIHRQVMNEHFQEVLDITNTLNNLIPSGTIRDNIGKYLEAELVNGIKIESPKQLDVEIRISKLFNSSPEIFSKKITSLLKEQFIRPQTNDNLTNISAYIKLFDLLSLDEQSLNVLTEALFQKGLLQWKIHHYSQAISIFQATLALLSGQPYDLLQKKIADQLAAAYHQSFLENDLEELSHILKASSVLTSNLVHFQDEEHIQDALQASEKFYIEKKYLLASKKAQWALTLDPHQTRAQSLLAMSLFNLGNFEEAYAQFQKIPSFSPEEIAALGVILPSVNHFVEGLELQDNLLQSDFKQQTIWALTLAKLLKEDFQQAYEWSAFVEPVNDELLLVQLYVSQALGQWDKVIEIYPQLSAPIQSIPIVKQFIASAFTSQNNQKEAEKYLKEMLNLPKPSLDIPMTPLFSTFLDEKITPFDGNTAIAMYYEQSGHDPSKALDYFYKIANPSPKILLQIALLEKKQRNMFQARAILLKALTQLNKADDKENLKAQVLLAMGQLLIDFRAYPEAVSAFQSSFTFIQPTGHSIKNYAFALMGMQRYDLALEQWTQLSRIDPLPLANEIDMAECLIHLKDFNSVNALAKNITKNHPSLPLLERLRLARLMLISDNPFVFKMMTEKLTVRDVSSFPEMVELIKLMMEMGDMTHAWIYASDFRKVLMEHGEGCLLLAELMLRSENLSQAIRYAELGYKLEPWNNQLTFFLIKHIPKNRPLFDRVEKEYKENPENPTPLLNYAYMLIEQDLYSKAPATVEIETATHILNDLIRQNQSIPLAYALFGAAHLLKGHLEEAIEALMTCLHLDPSNIMAYQYLSILYQYLDNEEATVPLIAALLFAPADPTLWEQLSILYQRKEDVLDSQEALVKVMRFYPLRISTRLEYAELQMELQNLEDSKQTLESVLEIDAKNVQALKLLLRILYDPTLTLNQEKASVILNERKAIFDRLHALDPASAEALEKQFSPHSEH